MTILCMLTILLSKHCRGHAKCSELRNRHYTTILGGKKHCWGSLMHTVTTAMPNTYRSHIYADCNHCNTNQPAEKMTILCILTILLGRHCRDHATCSRPRNWHYTTIFNERKHFGVQFMHTVTTAMPVNLPEQCPFNECSLYCSANIAGVTPNVLGLGPNTIPPYLMTEHIPDSHLCIL